jgi:putative DNA primase/helicase
LICQAFKGSFFGADLHLVGRGIQVPDEALGVLGFHWHCPFGERRRAPALVALVQDIITGEPIAIHSRELTPNATKAGSWMALGPKSGGAIRLSRSDFGELAIGEGVEICLAGIQLGSGPTWPVIDAGGMTAPFRFSITLAASPSWRITT